MLTTATVLAMLAGNTRSLGELNDAAVNTVRDWCAANGYNAAVLMKEEIERIETGDLGLEDYKRARRTGSMHRLNRTTRIAVWAAHRTRVMLRARKVVGA